MLKKVSLLSIVISLSQVAPAWARCFDEECVESRISAFFYLLPLLIWGGLFWFNESEYSNADMRNDSETFPKEKRRKTRLTFLITFILVITFMTWWDNFF